LDKNLIKPSSKMILKTKGNLQEEYLIKNCSVPWKINM